MGALLISCTCFDLVGSVALAVKRDSDNKTTNEVVTPTTALLNTAEPADEGACFQGATTTPSTCPPFTVTPPFNKYSQFHFEQPLLESGKCIIL